MLKFNNYLRLQLGATFCIYSYKRAKILVSIVKENEAC
jgi:hypothetical protein